MAKKLVPISDDDIADMKFLVEAAGSISKAAEWAKVSASSLHNWLKGTSQWNIASRKLIRHARNGLEAVEKKPARVAVFENSDQTLMNLYRLCRRHSSEHPVIEEMANMLAHKILGDL